MTTPGGDYASDAEIEEAIRRLTDADTLRLRRVAEFRARMLTGLGLGMGAEDLLQEAVMRTVASGRQDASARPMPGVRRWRKEIPFVTHLMETMRSIANHAPDELRDAVVVPATADDEQGNLDGVDIRSKTTSAMTMAAAREKLAAITKAFADDDEVGLVLEGLASGSTGPEIQRDLGITEQEFETIMLRLRRGIDRAAGWRP